MTKKRAALGLLLIVTGLAQIPPGARAVDGWFKSWLPAAISTLAAAWLAPVLWLAAMLGLVAAGFGALGMLPLTTRWRSIAMAALASSLLLVVLFWTQFAPFIVVLDLAALAVMRGWTGQARSATEASGDTRATSFGSRKAPTAPARRIARYLGQTVAAALLVYLTGIVVLRHWYNNSGSSESERAGPLPGDALTPEPAHQYTRAITVRAPVSAIWPWLVQLGQDRAGVYSYDRLERAFGLEVHNADRIVPEWQHLAVGDLVRVAPPDWLGGRLGRDVGLRVAQLEPNRALGLTSSMFNWSFVLQPLDSQTTRLIVRTRIHNSVGVGPYFKSLSGVIGFEPVMYIMESKMLRTLKERVESSARVSLSREAAPEHRGPSRTH